MDTLLCGLLGFLIGLGIMQLVLMWRQGRLHARVEELVDAAHDARLQAMLSTADVRNLRIRDREVRFLNRACARKNKRLAKLEDTVDKQVRILNDYDVALSNLREKLHALTQRFDCPVCGGKVLVDAESKAPLVQELAEVRANLNSRRLSAGGLGARV